MSKAARIKRFRRIGLERFMATREGSPKGIARALRRHGRMPLPKGQNQA